MQKIMMILLVLFLPLTVAGSLFHLFSDIVLFALACLTIIPLAGIMGRATESISIHSGPRIGGLLNATFGNAVELIIAFLALRQGLTQVVQASITGSIIGNLLLVGGISFLVGGLKYKVQSFDAAVQRTNSSMMMLGVVIALVIPAIFSNHNMAIANRLSLGVAIVTMVIYLLGLYFALVTHKHLLNYAGDMDHEEAEWSVKKAMLILAAATIAVGYVSETLVHTIESVSETLGWSEVFIGVIIVAIVGNAAEHSTAVLMAWKNRMDISMEIAIGSSLQIAMFVAPLLVFAGYFMGTPMPLVFTWPETAAMSLSVILTALMANDGESHWLEGAMALGAYIILAMGFYFL